MGGIDIGMMCANNTMEAFYRVVNTMGFIDLQSYIDSYPGYDSSSKTFKRVQENYNRSYNWRHQVTGPAPITVWEINRDDFDYYLDDYFDMRFAVGSKPIQNGAYFTIFPSVKDVEQIHWMWGCNAIFGGAWWFCYDWNKSIDECANVMDRIHTMNDHLWSLPTEADILGEHNVY